MADPKLNYLQCADANGGHRMAYWDWGDPQAQHVVVCVHGLARQARDFDVLAQSLLRQATEPLRVICPDVVGRGHSDWLVDPMAYQIPTYVGDMLALLAELKLTQVDWVGTSMGGLIGLVLSAHAASVGARVNKLVLNDVGPVVQWAAITRIAAYLGKGAQYSSLEEAAQALLLRSASFGPHTPEQWLELSRAMVKPVPGQPGMLQLHYDPAIAIPVAAVTPEAAAQGEALMWQIYDSLNVPTLLLRGADSDLLSVETARAMAQRGPKAQVVEFAGVGHAPTLVASDQLAAVAGFLLDIEEARRAA